MTLLTALPDEAQPQPREAWGCSAPLSQAGLFRGPPSPSPVPAAGSAHPQLIPRLCPRRDSGRTGSARQPVQSATLQGPPWWLVGPKSIPGEDPAGDLHPWGAGERVDPWAFPHLPKQAAVGRKTLAGGAHPWGAGPTPARAPAPAALPAFPPLPGPVAANGGRNTWPAPASSRGGRVTLVRATRPRRRRIPSGRPAAAWPQHRLSWGARCGEQSAGAWRGRAWLHPAAAPPVACSPDGTPLPADPLFGEPS